MAVPAAAGRKKTRAPADSHAPGVSWLLRLGQPRSVPRAVLGRLVSRRFDVVSGFEEVEGVATLIGRHQMAAYEGAERLAAIAGGVIGKQGPTEDQAHIMEIGLEVFGQHPIVGPGGDLVG